MTPGLLVDFGGVLTVPLHTAFAQLADELGLPPRTALGLLATHPGARQALAQHEIGQLDDEGFERAYAAALVEAGATGSTDGLLRRIGERLDLEPSMIDLVHRVRAHGVSVALVSNSLGRDSYARIDLDALFDVVVISGRVGVRKPSRAIYRLACERLQRDPADCVLVDDLQQNLDGAARLGITGVLHHDPTVTIPRVEQLLGLASQ